MTYDGTDANDDGIVEADVDNQSVSADAASIGPNSRDWGDTLHLFAIGGQSNAAGSGSDATATPDVTEDVAIQYNPDSDSIESPLDDPVVNDGDNTASAWPAFAKRYYRLTGVKSAYVMSAVDSSSQSSTADSGAGNWSSTGNLRSNLVSDVQSSITKLNAQGYNVLFRGILWSQGEADGTEITNTSMTISEYKTELQDMLSYYDGEFSDPWSFYIFETGVPNDGDRSGWKKVRRAQRETVREVENAFYASGRQRDFPDLGYMGSTLHYNTDGYNLMGRTGAERIAQSETTPVRQTVKITKSSGQNIRGDGTSERITWDTVVDDELDQAALASDEIEIEGGGNFNVSVLAGTDGSIPDGTSLRIQITVNGTTKHSEWDNSGAANFEGVSASTTLTDLSDGDNVAVLISQDSGSGQNILANEQNTNLTVTPV